MSDQPATQTDRIFHETKFVFLSCAQVSEASVVHTTVDISISEAWEHAPKKTKILTAWRGRNRTRAKYFQEIFGTN